MNQFFFWLRILCWSPTRKCPPSLKRNCNFKMIAAFNNWQIFIDFIVRYIKWTNIVKWQTIFSKKREGKKATYAAGKRKWNRMKHDGMEWSRTWSKRADGMNEWFNLWQLAPLNSKFSRKIGQHACFSRRTPNDKIFISLVDWMSFALWCRRWNGWIWLFLCCAKVD